ncbi:lipooligosaccharide biosynthesis family 4 glycosyltransferase LsgC [Lactovum odontotermitis]
MKSKKMKICFVSGGIHRTGGTERVGTMIANELSRRGYEVTILCFFGTNEKSFFPLSQDVKIHYLMKPGIEGKIYHFTKSHSILKYHQYLRNEGFDVVIDIDSSLANFTVPALKRLKTKYIAWEHFNYQHTITSKKRQYALKLIKKRADKLLVLTKQDFEMHVEAGVSENKIAQIYNPNPFENYIKSRREQLVFLSVGKPSEVKGYDLLLEAWKKVSPVLPKWKLRIVGDAQDEDELKRQIQKNKLKRVELVGHSDKIEKIYDEASVYVLTSRHEGFPMVLLEAMAKGLPVIAFDCITGPRELITSGENGELVPYLDIERFASEMINVAQDRKLQNKYSKSALEKIEKFNMEEIGNQWEELIRDLWRVE